MSRSRRLWVVFALNLALVGGLVAVGLGTGSLGVFAEGVDYLGDAAGIGVSLLAIRLSSRDGPGGRPRRVRDLTAVAALINGGWLVLLSALVSAGAVLRLLGRTRAVDGLAVLVSSGIAALVMGLGALVLGGDDGDGEEGDTLNIKAVLLDTAGDAAAAGGVALAGGLILLAHGLYWLDPAVALLVSGVVGFSALRLVAKVVRLLRRARPEPRVRAG